MTRDEIAQRAERLRGEASALPETVSFSNYRRLIEAYRQILNDTLVLVRELAKGG